MKVMRICNQGCYTLPSGPEQPGQETIGTALIGRIGTEVRGKHFCKFTGCRQSRTSD